jgi:hypothetical protein
MTLPSSGPISLLDIQAEFGGPASPISLSNYYKNGPYVTATSYAPNVPTSGPIALSNFYGSRKLSLYTFTYTSSGTLTLPGSFAGSLIINSLLGGGGGGGGGDGGRLGYSGYPGQLITNGTVSASPGDTVSIYIGGGGAYGGSGSGAAGGSGGPSVVAWSTLDMLSNPNNFRETNPRYCGFLNQYGIWNYGHGYPSFDQTVTVNVPFAGNYTVNGSADNYGTVYIDGNPVLSIGGYDGVYTSSVYLAAGNHSVRVLGINPDPPSPGAIGVTINGGFSGGDGGRSGYQGGSGAGGGGGAGSAIAVNTTLAAVAAGGGGGGGSGLNSSGRPNQGNPGTSGATVGGNGQDKDGDGGGGGGGAGGYNGGVGGSVVGGDDGAYSGENGNNLVPSGAATTSGNNGGSQGPTSGTGGSATISYYA